MTGKLNDLYTTVGKPGGSTAGHGVGIGMDVVDGGNPGVQDRVGARTGASCVIAGFKGNHCGTALSIRSRLCERHNLGVRATWRLGRPNANEIPCSVQDCGTNRRVWAGGATNLLGGRHGALQGFNNDLRDSVRIIHRDCLHGGKTP